MGTTTRTASANWPFYQSIDFAQIKLQFLNPDTDPCPSSTIPLLACTHLSNSGKASHFMIIPNISDQPISLRCAPADTLHRSSNTATATAHMAVVVSVFNKPLNRWELINSVFTTNNSFNLCQALVDIPFGSEMVVAEFRQIHFNTNTNNWRCGHFIHAIHFSVLSKADLSTPSIVHALVHESPNWPIDAMNDHVNFAGTSTTAHPPANISGSLPPRIPKTPNVLASKKQRVSDRSKLLCDPPFPNLQNWRLEESNISFVNSPCSRYDSDNDTHADPFYSENLLPKSPSLIRSANSMTRRSVFQTNPRPLSQIFLDDGGIPSPFTTTPTPDYYFASTIDAHGRTNFSRQSSSNAVDNGISNQSRLDLFGQQVR